MFGTFRDQPYYPTRIIRLRNETVISGTLSLLLIIITICLAYYSAQDPWGLTGNLYGLAMWVTAYLTLRWFIKFYMAMIRLKYQLLIELHLGN